MARIAVFIDHDIMVRHFVLSGVLAPLAERHDLVFVFPENHKRVQSDLGSLGLGRTRTIAVSPQRMYLYRRLYHATVLRRMRRTVKSHREATRRVWRELLGRSAFWRSWLCSWSLTYPLYKARMLAKIGDNVALSALLEEERPDVILHPTVLEGLFVSDLVRWGERKGVPTVFIMNSWDNPATKAMLVGHPTRLLVWGEQTRQHAIRHLGIPADRVVCLGAAQFDVYRDRPPESPEAYRRRLGIPPGRHVLLYAGSSKGLDETNHLLRLEQAIERGDLRNCFVVYRPHPWRVYPPGEADFYARPWRHVVLEPCMEECYRLSRDGTRMRVDLARVEDTHSTLSAVDAVISPLSTILLEAALHGKPVAAYLPDEDMKTNQHLSTVASMAHFVEFFEQVDCIKCERPDRFVADCRRLLEKTEEPDVGEKLMKQCEYFVEPSDRSYASRLHGLLDSLVRAGSYARG